MKTSIQVKILERPRIMLTYMGLVTSLFFLSTMPQYSVNGHNTDDKVFLYSSVHYLFSSKARELDGNADAIVSNCYGDSRCEWRTRERLSAMTNYPVFSLLGKVFYKLYANESNELSKASKVYTATFFGSHILVYLVGLFMVLFLSRRTADFIVISFTVLFLTNNQTFSMDLSQLFFVINSGSISAQYAPTIYVPRGPVGLIWILTFAALMGRHWYSALCLCISIFFVHNGYGLITAPFFIGLIVVMLSLGYKINKKVIYVSLLFLLLIGFYSTDLIIGFTETSNREQGLLAFFWQYISTLEFSLRELVIPVLGAGYIVWHLQKFCTSAPSFELLVVVLATLLSIAIPCIGHLGTTINLASPDIAGQSLSQFGQRLNSILYIPLNSLTLVAFYIFCKALYEGFYERFNRIAAIALFICVFAAYPVWNHQRVSQEFLKMKLLEARYDRSVASYYHLMAEAHDDVEDGLETQKNTYALDNKDYLAVDPRDEVALFWAICNFLRD